MKKPAIWPASSCLKKLPKAKCVEACLPASDPKNSPLTSLFNDKEAVFLYHHSNIGLRRGEEKFSSTAKLSLIFFG